MIPKSTPCGAQQALARRRQFTATHTLPPPSSDAEQVLAYLGELNPQQLAELAAPALNGANSLANSLKITPPMLDVLYRRGYDAYQAGDYTAAHADFCLLVLFQPHDYRFQLACGSALQQLEQFPLALAFFSRAAELNPSDPGAPFRMAECQLALDEIGAAQYALHTCLSLSEGSNDFHELSQQARLLIDHLN